MTPLDRFQSTSLGSSTFGALPYRLTDLAKQASRKRAAQHSVHRFVIVVAEPDPDNRPVHAAHEPGVAVIFGRASLARDRTSRQRRFVSCAMRDGAGQHPRQTGG